MSPENNSHNSLRLIAIILLVLGSSCNRPTPPSVEFCQQQFNSGTPTALVLLDPGETPIKEISVSFDRWELSSTPSSLVKEASISDLNGQIWQRADPVTAEQWWIPIPQEEWATNPLESLVVVSIQWPFSPPLTENEKLVYKLHLEYMTPEGNTLLANSDTRSISHDSGDQLTSTSEMCQDYLAFSIGG